MKQACIKKNCPYKRFAAPAKATPQLSKKQKKETKLQFTEGASSTKKRKRNSLDQEVTQKMGKKEQTDAVCVGISQGDGRKGKAGRSPKRQKVKGFSNVCAKTSDEAVLGEDIRTIIDSMPLKDDPVGNKIRLIIVKALKHPDNSIFQDEACELLRFMATSKENVAKIVLLGGLKMVSKAMKKHPQKSITQAVASALLAELTWVSQCCIAAIIEEGCLQLVVNSLQLHSDHLKVQQMGCGFFRAMSYDFENHQSINRANGVGAIIDSMSRNSKKDKGILKEACYFL